MFSYRVQTILIGQFQCDHSQSQTTNLPVKPNAQPIVFLKCLDVLLSAITNIVKVSLSTAITHFKLTFSL